MNYFLIYINAIITPKMVLPNTPTLFKFSYSLECLITIDLFQLRSICQISVKFLKTFDHLD